MDGQEELFVDDDYDGEHNRAVDDDYVANDNSNGSCGDCGGGGCGGHNDDDVVVAAEDDVDDDIIISAYSMALPLSSTSGRSEIHNLSANCLLSSGFLALCLKLVGSSISVLRLSVLMLKCNYKLLCK